MRTAETTGKAIRPIYPPRPDPVALAYGYPAPLMCPVHGIALTRYTTRGDRSQRYYKCEFPGCRCRGSESVNVPRTPAARDAIRAKLGLGEEE
ncbi:hypothetical protein [Alienimonas sp. DA493]|uniref:hypothetical protein n=1 Tax=Alienimonas sp. DA493 TaxID=3373605 RepID=UPI0037546D72